jgi:hypothetical protein
MFTKLWGGVIVGILIAFTPSFSQSVTDHNANVWLMYFGDHPFSSRWGVHLEAQARRSDMGLWWQQLLLRPGINYQINRYTSATIGYAFVNAYPYGNYPSRATLSEHRTFEQLWIKHPLGPIGLQHRLRLEQRVMQTLPSGTSQTRQTELRQRFRYMLRGDIPLADKGRVYLGLYDEFFINFGGNRGLRYLDQNRAYAAVGFKLSRFEKFEVGYLHQYIPQRNNRVFEHNHTLQIALFSSRPFRQPEAKRP